MRDERIFVKPAVPGSVVRHPEKINHRIPDEGEWVVNSTQWQRYINHGDVIWVKDAKNEDEAKPQAEVKQKGKADSKSDVN